MTTKNKLLLLALLALCLLLVCPAEAEEAKELTAECVFTSNARGKDFSLMTDRNFSTYYSLNDKKGWLDVESSVPIHGISISMLSRYGAPVSYDIQVEAEDGTWTTVASNQFLVDWFVPDEPLTKFRIKGTSAERIRISEIRIFGEGEKPADVQDWKVLDDCDLMLISCHPDDEVLWFAGLLPTYAGERNYKVQLVEMTTPTEPYPERPLELLACIWHCGVRYYPHFVGLKDKHGGSVEKQYTDWKGKNRVMKLVTEAIRKYKPEVIVTHGIKGEYGHSAHRVTSEAARLCTGYAANKKKFPESAKEYGTWQVSKLYLHEYDKNQIVMDWNQPLSAFGGKTGFDVAEEAYQFHATQTARDWEFIRGGEHDNTLFGLYYTNVGEDKEKNDFMEHITLGE